MDILKIKLMYREAKAFLHDSELLSNKLPPAASDANYLLRLLSFELLIKCLSTVLGIQIGKRHNYKDLYSNLPKNIRDEIISNAEQDYSGHADYSDINSLLRTFEEQFVKLRYPYEYYEGLNEEEYKMIGEKWAENGMPLEQAIIRYYPWELKGLIDSLKSILAREIANQTINSD